MTALRNLTLQSRLLAGFGAVAALYVLLTTYVFVQMASINAGVVHLYEEFELDEQADEIVERVLLMNQDALRAIIRPDTAPAAVAANAELEAEVHTLLDGLRASVPADELGRVEAVQRAFEVADDAFDEVLELVLAGDIETAVEFAESEVGPAAQDVQTATIALADHFEEEIERTFVAVQDDYVSTRTVSTVFAAIVAALALGLGYLLARAVSRTVAASVGTLSRSSSELAAVSAQLSATAEETATQANVVAAAGEEVSTNVTTVAAAVEEMSSSVREIAESSGEASRVAMDAVSEAERTNTTITRLGESSAEIGKVIEVITSIAEQTNLLALNATIEAARAGDAGKGFAVVAGEVKELAKETATATEDIGRRIASIQTDSDEAVGAIEGIGEVIGRIADMQATIASAVEEQTATTDEISRNIAEAARGSSEIADNVSSVAQAASETSEGAAGTQETAASLTAVVRDLQALVGSAAAAVEAAPDPQGTGAGGPGAPTPRRSPSPAGVAAMQPFGDGGHELVGTSTNGHRH